MYKNISKFQNKQVGRYSYVICFLNLKNSISRWWASLSESSVENSSQGRESSNVQWKSTKSAAEDGVPVGNSHWIGNRRD